MILLDNTAGAVTSYTPGAPISGWILPEIDCLANNPLSLGIIALRFMIMYILSPLLIPLVLVTELSGSCTAMTPNLTAVVLFNKVSLDPEDTGV